MPFSSFEEHTVKKPGYEIKRVLFYCCFFLLLAAKAVSTDQKHTMADLLLLFLSYVCQFLLGSSTAVYCLHM